ncbi:MAG: hypothetical protein Q8K63_04435, partial [Acidimicrobiales bacterium]|nr:hypothetical protein [Acidimicrobiales bacterium]
MSTSAQFTFAAEFVAFLAAAAGLAMALLRGGVVVRPAWARMPLGAGFGFMAGAAFLRGSLLIDTTDNAPVVALRLLGLLIVIVGSLAWDERGPARQLLWIALVGIAVAVYGQALGDPVWGDTALIVGSVGILASVLTASRRSLAARVAASAAGVLLLMVLVLSLALSAVLSSTVENEAGLRLDARARTEVNLVNTQSDVALRGARLTAQSIATSRGALLLELSQQPVRNGRLEQDLAELSDKFISNLPIAYFSPDGKVLASVNFDPASLIPIAGSAVVNEARERKLEVSSVAVVGVDAMAIGAVPVLLPDRTYLGTVVVAVLLNDGYLNGRTSDDPRLRLALVTQTQRLASTPEFATGQRPRDLATEVLSTGLPRSSSFDELFFSVRPVEDAAGTPVMVLVATTPTTLVDDTRESLFRTLFLIAL